MLGSGEIVEATLTSDCISSDGEGMQIVVTVVHNLEIAVKHVIFC